VCRRSARQRRVQRRERHGPAATWAPTVCIQVPTLLTSAAIHSDRNNPIRNGAQVDDADPEPATPRSPPVGRPSHPIRAASAVRANLIFEPGQVVTEAHLHERNSQDLWIGVFHAACRSPRC
jgi:hypothetical protein